MTAEDVNDELVMSLTSFKSKIFTDELKIKILMLRMYLKAAKIRVRIKWSKIMKPDAIFIF